MFQRLLIGIALLLLYSLDIFSMILYPVVADELNVRDKPSIDGKIITKIKAADQIQIIKVLARLSVVKGRKGRWALIDTRYCKKDNSSETIKGWIFDYYIGYQHKFQPVQSIRKQTLKMVQGDNFCTLHIYPSGHFKWQFAYAGVGKTDRYISSGRIYRLRNVYLFPVKYGKQPVGFYLYLDSKNQLTHHEWYIIYE